jgi:Skp family chaperone for outer membrane proteins
MAITTLCMSMALVAIGQTPGSTRIAVVDIPAVSEQYYKTAELEAQFERQRISLNKERDALREKIERTGRSLQEELKPGTQEFQQRRKQLAMYEAEMQWFVEATGQRIEGELAKSLRMIYADLQIAVRAVAEENKIDVVLSADRLPKEAPQTTTQARQQIVLQKVLFWNPNVDLTAQVIAHLNQGHQPPPNAPTQGLAKPPLVEQESTDGQTERDQR